MKTNRVTIKEKLRETEKKLAELQREKSLREITHNPERALATLSLWTNTEIITFAKSITTKTTQSRAEYKLISFKIKNNIY